MSESKNNLIEEIRNFNEEGALALIEREGYDINILGENGKTALMYACELRLDKIALALIEREDYDINHIDYDIKTALMYACEFKLKEIALALIGREDCDINETDAYNKTALIYACELKLKEIALALIGREDCDINAIGEFGKNALIYACEFSFVEIASALIDKGCDLTIQDVNGESALMYACELNLLNIVKQIKKKLSKKDFEIEKGKKNKYSETVITKACMFNNLKCLKILTGKKVNQNEKLCLNSCKYYDLFQIKFTQDTFTKLYNLGEAECGAICLNTMGFSQEIVKELLKKNVGGIGIEFFEMEETINNYIADIKYNEPYRLEESKDNEVALNSFFIKNVYMIYGYFFNKLTKGYCTIIGFTREDDSGHYMVIAKSYTDTPYMFETQGYKTYRGKHNIIKFLAKQNIIDIHLYVGDIKLEYSQEFSLFSGNNTYIPRRLPTMNSNTIKLPTPVENTSSNNDFLPKKNNRRTMKMKQQEKKKLRSTVTRGATTAGLQRKKKPKRKTKKK